MTLVMTEVDLFERFGVGAGCFNHNVVFNHLGVIRLQCSWHRSNSFSIAHGSRQVELRSDPQEPYTLQTCER
jgi:hypothetical protein